MRSVEDIVDLYKGRKKAMQEDFARMQEFRDYIADKIPVPLAELDRNEKSAIANLAAVALEQMALRVGSTLPELHYPALRPGIKVSEDKARNRRAANLGWWEHNQMQAVLTLRGEYLFADAVAPVTVLPDPKTGVPTWRVRDPLSCLPAPSHDPLSITPMDCVFTHKQTWGSLNRLYGGRVANLRRRGDTGPDEQFTVLEYLDTDEIVTIVLPARGENYGDMIGVDQPLELDRIPNRAEHPLAFVPALTSVIGRKGKFNGTIGTHQMRAKLLALAYITAKRGAIPEPWVEPIDNASSPDILATPDMAAGTPGVIKGGRLRQMDVNPGFMTSPMLSILEREMRLAGGIPAEFGGEAASNVRTARRGDQLISSTVDFPIQRAQNLLAKSMEHEDRAAIAIAKKWTPGRRSFYVSWKKTGWTDYDPDVDFETDEHTVSYPFAGSDLNDATIRHAQKVGTGMWSKKTAREMDPEIPDAEAETDRILAEQVDEAFWQAVMTKVADPESRWGPLQVAQLRKLIATGRKDMFDAVAEIEQEMAEQTQAPPDAMPGVAGAPMPIDEMAPIPPVEQGLANLSSQLRAQFPINAAQGIA